jgi:predicted nucleotidyltransferase
MAEISLTIPRDRIAALKHYAARLSRSRPPLREEVLHQLRHHSQEITARFGVTCLSLFGSTVRGESRRQSDVDLLVEFEPGRPSGMMEFIDLKNWLESILNRPVDLVTPANIKPRIRQRIIEEAVRVI